MKLNIYKHFHSKKRCLIKNHIDIVGKRQTFTSVKMLKTLSSNNLIEANYFFVYINYNIILIFKYSKLI